MDIWRLQWKKCEVLNCWFQLGVVFLEQGKASQALAYLDKALEFDPEHEQALLNSAILLQELGRAELRKVARERLLKLLRKVSDASTIRQSHSSYCDKYCRMRCGQYNQTVT
jgi:Tfp pilus assembly protein PilF